MKRMKSIKVTHYKYDEGKHTEEVKFELESHDKVAIELDDGSHLQIVFEEGGVPEIRTDEGRLIVFPECANSVVVTNGSMHE